MGKLHFAKFLPIWLKNYNIEWCFADTFWILGHGRSLRHLPFVSANIGYFFRDPWILRSANLVVTFKKCTHYRCLSKTTRSWNVPNIGLDDKFCSSSFQINQRFNREKPMYPALACATKDSSWKLSFIFETLLYKWRYKRHGRRDVFMNNDIFHNQTYAKHL